MVATICRKCGASVQAEGEFCARCGAPLSKDFLVNHEDAIREFEHHESVLQNYRAMFLVSETFTASLAATRLSDAGLVRLLSVFGFIWLAIWIIVTVLRARVVRFFEQRDAEGALMRYHDEVESAAHRSGFWIFTVVFPGTFALLWLFLLMIAYHLI
jgi:hypothetical protein